MSDDVSIWKALGGAALGFISLIFGWHHVKLESLKSDIGKCREEIAACREGHVPTHQCNRSTDDLKDEIRQWREEIRADMQRIYDKLDEMR